MANHWYTPLALIAALAAPALGQETRETTVPAIKPTLEARLDNFADYDRPEYHLYDTQIVELTKIYNALFKDKPGHTPLDPYVVKSMIMQESATNPGAYMHDPMQISNKGDFGLSELQKPDIYRRLGIPDLSDRYKAFTPTPRKRGTLDYSAATAMQSRASIEGGIIFLYDKYSNYGKEIMETGEVFDHTLAKGETFDSIAKKEGSTIATIKALNPTLNPRKLRIGTVIQIRKASKLPVTWEKAVDLYNGEGVRNYDKDVFDRLKTRVQ